MMSKLLRVAAHEYRNHVLNKGFLLAILSVPLFLGLMIGMGIMTDLMRQDGRPVGYVDQSGWLSEPVALPDDRGSPLTRLLERPVSLIPYDSREVAHDALEAGRSRPITCCRPRIRRAERWSSSTPGRQARTQPRGSRLFFESICSPTNVRRSCTAQ